MAGPHCEHRPCAIMAHNQVGRNDSMEGFSKRTFSAPLDSGHSVSHDVYEAGTGPVIVIIQELPGIGPETLHLASRFQQRGFRVLLPHLFGPLGRTSLLGNTIRVLCMRREFRIFEAGKTSPIIAWLRALCRDATTRYNVAGVGTIGMCLTGNFAISLMADEAVLGGVASQPSLAIRDNRSLHMSEQDILEVRDAMDHKGGALAYRFEEDKLCTASKFESYAERFNDDRERIRLVTLPGPGHSVLTLDFVDADGHPTRAALDEVIGYFKDRLI